jgi:hypothetical protein
MAGAAAVFGAEQGTTIHRHGLDVGRPTSPTAHAGSARAAWSWERHSDAGRLRRSPCGAEQGTTVTGEEVPRGARLHNSGTAGRLVPAIGLTNSRLNPNVRQGSARASLKMRGSVRENRKLQENSPSGAFYVWAIMRRNTGKQTGGRNSGSPRRPNARRVRPSWVVSCNLPGGSWHARRSWLTTSRPFKRRV